MAIPIKLRKILEADPFMRQCIHEGCENSPEYEHCFIYAGKQIQRAWAIVPCCTYHHRGQGLDKNFNKYCALIRATDEDLAEFPRADFPQQKIYLITKYDTTKTKS